MEAPVHTRQEILERLRRLSTELREMGVERLGLFGSFSRDEARADSDVDILVEFEPEARVGLIRLAGMELDLGELLGRKVDMRTPQDLSRHFRDEVLRQAEMLHETR
jgi:hypothetical protein